MSLSVVLPALLHDIDWTMARLITDVKVLYILDTRIHPQTGKGRVGDLDKIYFQLYFFFYCGSAEKCQSIIIYTADI